MLEIPRDHEKYGWGCAVPECLRTRTTSSDFCSTHRKGWVDHLARDPDGATRAGFLNAAEPLEPTEGRPEVLCVICPDRPAYTYARRICMFHYQMWDN